MTTPSLLSATPGFWDSFQNFINWLTQPSYFITLATIVFVLMLVAYKFWTRPLVATAIIGGFCLFYFGSMANHDYRATITKPDNVPITIMVLSVMLCIWVSFRRAALNDARVSAGQPLLEEEKDDKVLVWPDLVYTELICRIAST